MKSLLIEPHSNNLPVNGNLKESMLKDVLSVPLSRRKFLKLTGISLLSYVLAACNGLDFRPTPIVEKKIQLVYQDWNTPWFSAMAQTMLKQFHIEHPNISAFYTLDPPSESFDEKTMADFQAGTAPDVFQGCCSFFPYLGAEGLYIRLAPLCKRS